ncbi:T9SS type A sorting domain-containing protein [Polaribacter aestuariivivens]|uniref:T9SS type A sorting domain-containing protein n=1 Tax=Polaribacter aestuariivivens TaxID=2304626 RepID=A0A5S3N0C6_9FLAO|nr:LamG-like jellyroll fold domain-containing protein [Polaribacter aestuariivivens]TMM28583.1 T9SS type A sorting domain-containing protein [Polaribacter aestuariivivens]
MKYLSSIKLYKSIAFFLLIYIATSNISYAQTISSTGSSATTCGNCTPAGYIDDGGTPDISNRTNAGGQGSLGENDTWVASPLPLPPTGDLTWISMRDVGDFNTSPVESVKTSMGDLIEGNVYKLTIYVMTAKSSGVGGDYYSGQYIDQFSYEINEPGVTPVTQIVTVTSDAYDKWAKTEVVFIGKPDIDGKMDLAFSPLDNAVTAGDDINFESVHIAIQLNDLSLLDTDGDGIVDADDVDDDNDGILDTVELTLSGTEYDPLGDEDGDKLPNYLDTIDDNISSDGSTTSYVTTGSGGIPDVYDFDDDGIPNHLDLDADNDGIPDNIEAQTTAGYIASSGAVGDGFTDANNNGLDDNYETAQGGTDITPVNSDSSGEADYRDLDSDDDTVSDTIEANLILNGNVGNNGLDKSYESIDSYKDVNGIFDDTQTDNFPDDGNNANLGLPNDVNWRDVSVTGFLDTDEDGVANNIDKDDDNDGIRDFVERCIDFNAVLTSQSGIVNSGNLTGEPDDNSGEVNTNGNVFVLDFGSVFPAGTQYEITWKRRVGATGTAIPIINESTDNTTYTRNLDAPTSTQSDNFQTDIVTSNVAFRYIQITKQTDPSITDFEVDAIGILNTTSCNNDSDGDGIANYLDLDSDNDGIPDNIEAQPTASYVAPTTFTDADNDGLDDNYDANVPGGVDGAYFVLVNTDSGTDTIPDYLDTDSDNDGTPDLVEANLSLFGFYGINGLDSNYESADNFADVNGTFDNTPYNDFPDNPSGGEVDWRDATSTFRDTDNDGVPDTTDLDDDNDGILDTVEGCSAGTMSTSNLSFTTVGGSGLSYTSNNITFTNGTAGFVNSAHSPNFSTFDTPTDYEVSYTLDGTFLDNTERAVLIGINEAGTNSTNSWEDIDYTFYISGSGESLQIYENGTFRVNVSNGASGNKLTIKKAGKSITYWVNDTLVYSSLVNANGTDYFVDSSFFGQTSTYSINNFQITHITNADDTDNDGILNCLDLDSDNDGIPDNIEAQTTIGYEAPDGVYDANGVDTAYTGGLTPVDTDSDTTKDFLDIDSDDDGILDNVEAGLVLTGTYGNNGLDNAYDNGDNYSDVNGSFDNSQTNNFPDEDSDVLNGGDVDYRDDTFTIDTDGDNVSDEVDLDDDNDGILDSVEIVNDCTVNNGVLNWNNEYTEGDTVATNGDDPIEVDDEIVNANVTIKLSRTSNVISESNYRVNDNTTTDSAYNLSQLATANAESRHVFNFSAPVLNLGFTIYDVNRDDATSATDVVKVIITKQDGSNYTLDAADYTTDGAANTYSGSNTFTGTTTTAGNVIINPIPEYVTKLQFVYSNLATGSFLITQNIAIGNLSFCTPIDSDGDGIFDFRDLDSDNDGIPDNIEAQTTQGYIPPTNSFSLTGIDLAYGTGLTVINTDGDTQPDYLDLDSDNDSTNDIDEGIINEALPPNSGGMFTGTVGINGLVDALEASDTDQAYTDINGIHTDPKTDGFLDDSSDNDVNIGGDLDYRDDILGVDTDKDGIANNIDIDDDNDGIPDVLENTPGLPTPDAVYSFENTTNDSSGNDFEQQNAAVPAYSSDNIVGSNAIEFNGTFLIQYSDGTFLNQAVTTLTHSVWVKPDDLTGVQEIIDEGGNTNGLTVRLNGNTLEAAVREGNVSAPTTSLTFPSDNNWHHVAVTYNNGDLTLYLDGVASTTISSGFGELAAHSDGSGLGGRNNDDAFANSTDGDYFDGLMDEYYHYPVALTPAEIAVLANLDNPIDTDGDGVINSLDIDSDNDGIPDNVEAQTTLGYISPSGIGNGITDANNNGLDDNYETAQGGTDITPNNNDGTDNPDYIDTDSDNDGIFDISENNVTNSEDAVLDENTGASADGTPDGIVDPSNFTDTDGDGLADVFEGTNTNDNYDVNDEIDNPQSDLPDTDSDVATEDVDFRDDSEDPISPGVAGNILWLRADKDVTGTTSVTSWVDQTASLHDATSDIGTAPSKIDVGLNFNPVIDFDPTSNQDLIITNGILGTDTYSNLWSYVVVNPNVVNANGFIFLENVSGSGNFHNRAVSSTNLRYRFGDPTDQILNISANENTYNLFTTGATTTPGSAPTGVSQAIHVQGNPLFTNNTTLVNITGVNDDFDIGSNGSANFWNGQIAEIMIFNETPTAKKQQQVESYLAIKYGFTLSTVDYNAGIIEGDYLLQDQVTKVWNYSANTAYHNNVAGIGRDDAMALNQKQSKSNNPAYDAITNPNGQIITIGLNAIAADNVSNANTFASNKDFLMWGNNTGVVNTVTETELICAPEKTIGRTWKIVENGSVSSVQVAANKAAIDGALTTPNTVKVLKIADDASFTTNVKYVPLTDTTINSENVYAANYDFNGVKYFTYSEINGIFWNGDIGVSGSWFGGNSLITTNGPSTQTEDRDKVMVIDSQTSLTHAILTESVEVECVWVKANSKLMVADDQYLEFDEDFILDGQVRLIGDGQLVQTHVGLSNVQGSGKLFRDQQAVVPNVYRYHYWTSPVRELGLDTYRVGQVMKDGTIPTSASSSIVDINWVSLDQSGVPNRGLNGATGTPITISNYWIYTNENDPAEDDERSENYVRKLETGVIKRGLGYTMKSTGANPQNFTFVGTPNDGSISIPVTANTATLVGNPYPSALDATDFINTNIDAIEGTLYFWEHTGEDTEPSGISGHTFAGYYGGYSQRNLTMGIAANGVPSTDPLTYDWETAVDNGSNVTQTVEGIEVIVEYSNNTIIIDPNVANIGGTTAKVVTKSEGGTDTYDITFTFDDAIDIKSIFLFNNAPSSPVSDPTVTLTPDNSQPVKTQLLTGSSGQEIFLNWEDVTTFTITANRPYNLVIDDIEFSNGNFPSLGEGTYHAPNRYIAVAQGFFIRANEDGGTIRFENSQRNYKDDDFDTGGTFFFKSKNSKKGNKNNIDDDEFDLLPILKLGFNRTTSDLVQLHRQIGISFRQGNTFKYENGFDSEIFDVGENDMYWNFPEMNNRKLVIAGVSEITNELEIPLTIATTNSDAKSIQIDEVKNINRPIYLLDKLTNTYYTLSRTPIELTIENGVYTDRFYITFENKTALSTDEVNPLNNELTTFVDQSTNEIVIQNNKLLKIKKVALYNILGQKVREWKNIDNITENRLKTNKLSATVYILNVETENGKISKKIMIE